MGVDFLWFGDCFDALSTVASIYGLESADIAISYMGEDSKFWPWFASMYFLHIFYGFVSVETYFHKYFRLVCSQK